MKSLKLTNLSFSSNLARFAIGPSDLMLEVYFSTYSWFLCEFAALGYWVPYRWRWQHSWHLQVTEQFQTRQFIDDYRVPMDTMSIC